MAIKPLEESDDRGLGLKIGFLIALLVAGYIISKVMPKPKPLNILGVSVTKKTPLPSIQEETTKFIKETSNNLINDAIDTVSSFASQSATTVTDAVFTNTVVNVVKQIDKLAPKQQEEIKKAICQ